MDYRLLRLRLNDALSALADLLMPRVCLVCGRELTLRERFLCLPCSMDLPLTRYETWEHNPMADKYNLRITPNPIGGLPEPYQRARIDAEQTPRGSVIHLPWEEFQNLSALQAICPLQVPVPPVDQPDHTVPAHYDLLCYRKDRSADGAWGEPFADLLIASNKVLEQHYQEQRKQSRKKRKSD